MENIGGSSQHPVTKAAMERHFWRVFVEKTRAFGKIVAIEEWLDEFSDFFGVGCAVGIEGYNNIALSMLKAILQGISFACSRLVEN